MEEEYYSRSFPMEKTVKIMRRSIHVFLKNYQCLSSTAAFFGFPFAILVLLLESFVSSSSLLRIIQIKIQSFFDAAGFPRTSEFFTILNLKLSQTLSTSFVVLPLTFSFLLLSKAFVIQVLGKYIYSSRKDRIPASFLTIYKPLFLTQICNILVIISANATCFCILFFAFNSIEGFGISDSKSLLFFSATGAVLYSIVLANALIICNLALVLSGIENSGGYLAILKAFVLIRGRTATALTLAVPINLALAAVEALFQYRIVKAYYQQESYISLAMAMEGMLIAYLYSVILVLDTVVGCLFYRSCKTSMGIIDLEEQRYRYRIEIQDRENGYTLDQEHRCLMKALDDLSC